MDNKLTNQPSADETTLTARVQLLLTEALQISPDLVSADLSFGDLPQWDSMGHMEVMLSLEEHFGIEINAETIAALTSIPVICAAIKENRHA